MYISPDDIALLRRYTGDAFTAKNGYDFRKKLTRSRYNTAMRYLEKIRVLTGNGYNLVAPKKGEKKILYDYTGQGGFNRFKYAIVRTPKGNVKLNIKVNKKAPRGQQVTLDFPTLKQTEIKIAREYILYFVQNELKGEFIEYVDQVAPDARVFIINSEGGSLWQRTAGDSHTLADIVFELAEKYDTRRFSRNDYSHFDNWIESVSCLTNYDKALSYIDKRYRETRETRTEFFRKTGMEHRNIRYSSKFGGHFITEEGEFLDFVSNSNMKEMIKMAKATMKKSKGKRRNDKEKIRRQKIKGR